MIAAVDVGGSGLRVAVVGPEAGSAIDPASVRTAEGIRIGPNGVSLTALIETTRSLLSGVSDLHALCFAARSFPTLAEPTEVFAAVRTLGAAHTVLCADAVSSLVGAVGAVRPGAVIAAGTGAIAFATDFAGTVRRVDGWGHVLGDRGSGSWIGLQALRRLLERTDCGDTGGALFAAAVDHFGPQLRWPRQVMMRDDAPALLGAFAPRVTALVADDPLAAELCQEAGEHLARSLLSAARAVPDDAALTINGGVLQVPVIRSAFDAAMSEAGRAVVEPHGSSLDGAALIAHFVAQGRTVEPFPPYLLTD